MLSSTGVSSQSFAAVKPLEHLVSRTVDAADAVGSGVGINIENHIYNVYLLTTNKEDTLVRWTNRAVWKQSE